MFFAASAAFAEVQTKSARIGTTTVHYKVVLPTGYTPAKVYPAILAFGGGPQTVESIDRALHRNWQKEAESRGYIVVLPAAPDDVLFFQGGEKMPPTPTATCSTSAPGSATARITAPPTAPS